MIGRILALYSRYRHTHLVLEAPGREIRNSAGDVIGYVDLVRVNGGLLTVAGWALAERVRLVLGGQVADTTPRLTREDVANGLGVRADVGFELTLPTTLAALRESDPPGLIVTEDAGQPRIDPISVPIAVPLRSQTRVLTRFLLDGAAAAPAVLAWRITRDPAYRQRVKERLRLSEHPARTTLESHLFRTPEDTDPDLPRPRITIIVPVYNAFDLLRECLDRVERHTDLPWRMIVIEDGSTDPAIRPWLREWAASRDRVELLENPGNRGFIASVNRGLAQAMQATTPQDGPVILLNTDALVPEGWASRLIRPMQVHEDIATVTPMSNDAEIFSVPHICTRTVLTPGQGDAIDAVAQRFAPEALLTLAPTGVGFCMAMGRDWLRKVPQLDPAFGRGYGEEVDWCQKVARLGGRHLGLPGLFVEHRGGESFGSEEKRRLVATNNAIVAQRYPGYDMQVQQFIGADQMCTARLALGLGWATSLDPEEAVPVYIAHVLGGGAEHYLENRIAMDLEAGRPSVVLRVGGPQRWMIELVTPAGTTQGQTDDSALIEKLLACMTHRHFVYSCAVGDPDPVQIPGFLAGLLTKDDTAEMLFHDYFPLSPSYTLLDSDGRYLPPVVAPRDDPAHATRRRDGTPVSLEDWQNAWEVFARQAEIVVFSENSAAHVRAVWPHLEQRMTVRPHLLLHDVPRLPAPAADAPKVLAVLGNIGMQKGAAIVQALGKHLAGAAEPKLVLIGNIDPAYALDPSVQVHGSYAMRDIGKLARHYGVTHWLIPSVWPETFCYTAHEALATGLPVLAFGIGAQGDAVRKAPNGIEMPFDLDADLAQTVLICLSGDTRRVATGEEVEAT